MVLLPILMKRAAVAPAKPPPITTTFGPAPCAMAGIGSNAAALAVFRNWRRFVLIARLLLLLLVPGRDRAGLLVGEALRDTVHDRALALAGLEGGHLADDLRRRPSLERRHRRLPIRAGRMAPGARGRPGRSIRCHRDTGRCQQARGGDQTRRIHVQMPVQMMAAAIEAAAGLHVKP